MAIRRQDKLKFTKDDLALELKNIFYICEDHVRHADNEEDIYACRILINRLGNVVELFDEELRRHGKI